MAAQPRNVPPPVAPDSDPLSDPVSDPARAVLVTGCSSGIGACVAHGLAAHGYRVFATARRPEDVAQLAAAGLEAWVLDLDDSASILAAVDGVLEHTGGRLYALVNNAAYGQPGAVEDLSRETLRRQLETNLLGTHELTARILPVMRRQGEGRIVQFSSLLGYACLAFRGAYSASKFALEALTDTLRLELRGTGIQVSLIEPGPIRSRFRENAYTAFRAHIDPGTSPHRTLYEAVERRLAGAADMPFTLDPDAVLRRVVHALDSPRPRVRYRVTFPAHLLAVLKWLLPVRWMDRFLYAVGDTGKH